MTPERDITIRQLRRKDYPAWLPLWEANNDNGLSRRQADETWKKITTKSDPIFGLGLWLDGVLIGILHYTLHPVTARAQDVCYMQDIFIAPERRRQGQNFPGRAVHQGQGKGLGLGLLVCPGK